MTERPLVSVIIPLFNCDQFVAEALESVLQQDYSNVEVIAIDDGSTDQTTAIVEQYAPRVRLLHQKNRGPAAARNRGVRESKGKYIAFLDGDDVWLPGKLSAQIEHAERRPEHAIVFAQFALWVPGADGAYPPAAQLVSSTRAWAAYKPLSGWLYADILRDTHIHIITAVVRRDAFDALGGFDETLRAGSDYDFWLKATYRYEAHQLELPAALYRHNQAGITQTTKPINYGYVILSRAFERFGSIGPDGRGLSEAEKHERLARLCYSFGRRHYRVGDLRLARDAFLQSMRHAGVSPRALAYFALASIRAPFRRRYQQG